MFSVKQIGSEEMNESLIIGTILKIYGRLMLYYENSMFYMVLQRVGQGFGKHAASSSILSFLIGNGI